MSRVGRVGLSEFTTQRLAELRARRAESEALDGQNSTVTTLHTSSAAFEPLSLSNSTGRPQFNSSIIPKKVENIISKDTVKGNDERAPRVKNTEEVEYKDNTKGTEDGKYNYSSKTTTEHVPVTIKKNLEDKTYSSNIYQKDDQHKSYSHFSENKTGRDLNAHKDGYIGGNGHFKEEEERLGFASLPEQMHRKALKKGFDFTIMLVGDSGLGKSTFMKSLLCNEQLYAERMVHNAHENINKTVTIEKQSLEIEEKGVKLRLTVVDTPGFNDSLNAQNCWEVIKAYLDNQFEQYLNDECGLDRRHILDGRVHCCLYFLSPYGRGLRPLDIECMQQLSGKINIIPVIAKADVLTRQEMARLKDKIRQDISNHNISVYELATCESDDDDETVAIYNDYKKSMPFAIASSNTYVQINGTKVKGRIYPWGLVEVENPIHSDFAKLRQLLLSTHMQDLKDSTKDIHYESYRTSRIKAPALINGSTKDAETALREKQDELAEMQRMLQSMKKQLAMSNATNC